MATPASCIEAPRLCVTALSGGGGKTMLALGLARAFTRRGIRVQPFKKGPDYIDAAWLSLASRGEVTNLDPYFLDADRLRSLFVHAMETADPPVSLGLVEGNRGLYDGFDAAGSCSTAMLARILDCPLLLSLTCSKMTRTAAALVQGIVGFEPGLRIAGVVLNKVGSSRHETILRQVIEENTGVPVLGALPRLAGNPLPERHMGLASHGADLRDDAEATMDALGDIIGEHVDLDSVLSAARSAPPIPRPAPFWPEEEVEAGPIPLIGYVKDSVLWFYYRENLEALTRAGARLVRLSLLDDAPWPEIDGCYLGGGFPEDAASTLSASPKLSALAGMVESGMPIFAECGGFMLLSRGIRGKDGFHSMADAFPVTVEQTSRPQGLGYVSGKVVQRNPFLDVDTPLRGHEFHYSRCVESVQGLPHALLLDRGIGMGRMDDGAPDGLLCKRTFAGYTHIFAPALPAWARNFVRAARTFAAECGRCAPES
jgi:cobyrinic acid a,c-diamide synthase